jgi:DNA repair protein RecO
MEGKGLLLLALPYLGEHRILKVLMPEEGLVTLMAKHSASKKGALTTPFVLAEWIFTKDHREIHTLKEGTLLEDFAALKQSYDRLSAAGRIAQDLLRTQLPSKAAHAPFELALAMLRKLATFPKPELLAASFRLKLLAAEGLLDEHFDPDATLQALAFSRSFSELASLSPHPMHIQTIDQLFEERLR